jgi:hypothetical protein
MDADTDAVVDDSSAGLAGAPGSTDDAAAATRGNQGTRHMRRAIVTFSLCWIAWCGAPHSNTLPLAFGMTPTEASNALGVPLMHLSGRRGGSEILVATGEAHIPGYYGSDYGIALQFRNNRLTGWKKDWRLRKIDEEPSGRLR